MLLKYIMLWMRFNLEKVMSSGLVEIRLRKFVWAGCLFMAESMKGDNDAA